MKTKNSKAKQKATSAVRCSDLVRRHRRALRAAQQMDWMQVVLNGGPPCFHIDSDGSRFCGRAERWGGHGDLHAFVSLADLLRTMTPNDQAH